MSMRDRFEPDRAHKENPRASSHPWERPTFSAEYLLGGS